MKLLKEKIKVPATYSLTKESVEVQTSLLGQAMEIKAVGNSTMQQIAVNAGQAIRKHLNAVEKVRKEVIAPLLEAQRLVNKLAKDHSEPIKAELDRIERLVTGFQQAEAERVRQEEAARAEELRRLEAATKAPVSGDDTMQEIAAYQAEREMQAVIEAPLPEVQKAKGAATKQVLRWRCTDINKLYAARPDLCFPPIPKASAINSSCVPESPVPGLEMHWELDTTIRSR